MVGRLRVRENKRRGCVGRVAVSKRIFASRSGQRLSTRIFASGSYTCSGQSEFPHRVSLQTVIFSPRFLEICFRARGLDPTYFFGNPHRWANLHGPGAQYIYHGTGYTTRMHPTTLQYIQYIFKNADHHKIQRSRWLGLSGTRHSGTLPFTQQASFAPG